MVSEVRPDYPSDWPAIVAVAAKLGIGTAETLRKWVRQAEVNAGQRPGITSEESAETKRLKRENSELAPGQRDTEVSVNFLRGGARPPAAVLVRFISEHKHRFGVEPICRVLTQHGWPIAPSTYYDAVSRAPSARARRDELLKAAIARVHADNYGVYGARKVWLQLNREGTGVARCTVARLMRDLGLRGARRGKRIRTTIADPAAARPADLVRRQFSPPAPDRLWVADYTYVPAWTGMVYVAFVIDAYSRRILGWRAASSMKTALVLDALEQALWTRKRGGDRDLAGLIHHTDAGSQGEFNRSSQHLDCEELRWKNASGAEQVSLAGRRCGRLVGRRWAAATTGCGSGMRSHVGWRVRTPGRHRRSLNVTLTRAAANWSLTGRPSSETQLNNHYP